MSGDIAVYPAETTLNDLTNNNNNNNDDNESTVVEKEEQEKQQQQQQQDEIKPQKKIKINPLKITIPKISIRDLRLLRPHSPITNELEQSDYVLNGPGSKREPNKIKLKNIELEECIQRAKIYAREQSVRFVLVKQQQQQQKQQLDLIKKQQALLLMCR